MKKRGDGMFSKTKLSYWLLGFTTLAILALLIWPTAALSALPIEKSQTVSVARAARGSVEKTLGLAGVVAYSQERYAVSPQSGIAAWVTSKKEGEAIARDEALLRLDTTYQEALLAQACSSAQGDPQPYQSLLDLAQGQTFQSAEHLETSIRQSTIRAHAPGQVLQTLVRAGELVQAGAPVALLSSQEQQVRALISSAQRQQLAVGMPVRLEHDGKFLAHGRIDSLGAMTMDAATGLSSAPVTIAPASPLPMMMGDSVEVVVILEEAQGVVTVPLEALDAQGRIWQIHEGRAWPSSATVRLWNDHWAWAEGLAEGTPVILSPDPQLKSGQRVKEGNGG